MAPASPPPEASDIRWKQRFDNLQRYDDTRAKAAVLQIQTRYLSGLEQLHSLFSSKLQETP